MIRPISPTRPPRGAGPEQWPLPDPEAAPGAPTVRSHRMARRGPRPVFVDRSGRRRRIMVASGATVAVLVLFALTTLVAGLFGASPVPLPGLPDLGGPATNVSPPEQTRPTPVTEPAAPEPVSTGTVPEPTGSVEPTPPRHIPTQTPTHDRGRPTRT